MKMTRVGLWGERVDIWALMGVVDVQKFLGHVDDHFGGAPACCRAPTGGKKWGLVGVDAPC